MYYSSRGIFKAFLTWIVILWQWLLLIAFHKQAANLLATNEIVQLATKAKVGDTNEK